MNSFIKIALVVSASTLAASCASNPKLEYDQLLRTKKSEAVTNISDAFASSEPIVLAKGERHKFELDGNDPVINIGDHLSFYEIFQVHAKANERIKLVVIGHVKQRAVSAYVVSPRLFVVNGDTGPVDATLSGGQIETNLFGNYQYETKWLFTAPHAGNYRVLVTSDNSNLDQSIATHSQVMLVGALFIPVTHSYKAHGTGQMTIKWQ